MSGGEVSVNAEKYTTTILLVDDETMVTDALQRALRREPVNFLSAASAVAARALLLQHHVDVVVSDEQMPGMPGSEFLGEVRRTHPRAIRIMLSGQASLEGAVRAINDGQVHRFFLKPCNPVELMITIRQAVEQRRLEEQSRRLLREYQRQAARLATVERLSPDLLRLDIDDEGLVVVDESDGDFDVAELLAQIEAAIPRR